MNSSIEVYTDDIRTAGLYLSGGLYLSRDPGRIAATITGLEKLLSLLIQVRDILPNCSATENLFIANNPRQAGGAQPETTRHGGSPVACPPAHTFPERTL